MSNAYRRSLIGAALEGVARLPESPADLREGKGWFDLVLEDGERLVFRPVIPRDKGRLLDGFRRLSQESRFRRFLSGMPDLSVKTLHYLTEIDYLDHFALGAVLGEPDGPGVAVARYIRLPGDPEAAEAAVTVVDEYQRRGVGSALFMALASAATRRGISRFCGYTLWENQPVRRMLERAGAKMKTEYSGVLSWEMELAPLLQSTSASEDALANAR